VADLSGGRPRLRRVPPARRVVSWLAWWVLLMSLWVVLDDSIAFDELLAGAGAAAIAAFGAELASHQAGARFRIRAEWLGPVLSLPAQLLRDTVIVFTALWRCLSRGEQPHSGFGAEPVRPGPQTAEGATRRVLLVGGRSVAPNTFVLGLDREQGVLVVHHLVQPEREAAG
jgi:multisubunit Na+/H+ antiporter MnhE subunit